MRGNPLFSWIPVAAINVAVSKKKWHEQFHTASEFGLPLQGTRPPWLEGSSP
jgi:hypothetical protein